MTPDKNTDGAPLIMLVFNLCSHGHRRGELVSAMVAVRSAQGRKPCVISYERGERALRPVRYYVWGPSIRSCRCTSVRDAVWVLRLRWAAAAVRR